MRKPRAFTLVEVMIALGILGVGLAMIGTAFPAALGFAQDANNDTMGALVAQNAAALCRVKLRHGADGGPDDLFDRTKNDFNFHNCSDLIAGSKTMHSGDLAYPAGQAGAMFGWQVWVRKVAANTNWYQAAIIVYRRYTPADTIVWADCQTAPPINLDGTFIAGKALKDVRSIVLKHGGTEYDVRPVLYVLTYSFGAQP